MTAMTMTTEERRRQVALFRRKAEKVRAKGMSISVDGIMMRAVLAEIDALRANDPNDTSVADRHEAEKAALCDDHRAEMVALRAELDRACAERDAASAVAASAVEAARTGTEPTKQRAPRTKEEPWKSICIAADRILRDDDSSMSHLWGMSLLEALPEYGEAAEVDTAPWVRALTPVVPPVPASTNGNH
jgi:hypothetical protein